MATPNSVVTSFGCGDKVPGFAKLHSKNFVHFMQTYSIILGRNTKDSTVDVDLYEYGGQRVSRFHARIFYDFGHHHFALEVLGRNGCSIQGVSYLPGSDPVKLNSQDLIEIAAIKIYFLLPTRSMFATHAALDTRTSLLPQSACRGNGENGVKVSTNMHRKLVKQSKSFSGELDISNINGINDDPVGLLGGCVSELEILSADKYTDNQQLLRRADKDTGDQQLILEEENDVASCLAALISDLCSPGEWLPMVKLHSELLERFSKKWPHDWVRRYLTQNGGSGPSSEVEGRPWRSLLPLLRKYPEHFVMTTVIRGQATSEYVGLVHLVSLENKS